MEEGPIYEEGEVDDGEGANGDGHKSGELKMEEGAHILQRSCPRKNLFEKVSSLV